MDENTIENGKRKASNLSQKEFKAIFNDNAVKAKLPPKMEAEDMKPADEDTLNYARELKMKLCKAWGIKPPLDKP